MRYLQAHWGVRRLNELVKRSLCCSSVAAVACSVAAAQWAFACWECCFQQYISCDNFDASTMSMWHDPPGMRARHVRGLVRGLVRAMSRFWGLGMLGIDRVAHREKHTSAYVSISKRACYCLCKLHTAAYVYTHTHTNTYTNTYIKVLVAACQGKTRQSLFVCSCANLFSHTYRAGDLSVVAYNRNSDEE